MAAAASSARYYGSVDPPLWSRRERPGHLQARGCSRHFKLIRPDDYEMDEGARFEVHLTKARGITGDDALPFEARLTVLEGRDIWAFETLRDRVLNEIEQLTRERKSAREIADQLKLSKSKVNRLQAKLRDEGRIQARHTSQFAEGRDTPPRQRIGTPVPG
jgi:hypothetical protein